MLMPRKTIPISAELLTEEVILLKQKSDNKASSVVFTTELL